ncbi:hypothetical protein EU538_12915 [Candidatus Thorarchaeota archaeon]|nr:MAG: hypothetical protein EU538_12915 [Candidatus Thorarchaeota archaeon]
MDEEELEKAARIAYDAIFGDEDEVEVNGEVYPMQRTSRKELRKFSIEGLTFVEQNPKKDSAWAQKAREGHQIMWVLDGRKYFVRIMDGNYLRLG